MMKTQIQVPDEQYRRLRAFADEREWSLAETFRRAAELLLEVYPREIEKQSSVWSPPSSNTVMWMGLSSDAIKSAIAQDGEPLIEFHAGD